MKKLILTLLGMALILGAFAQKSPKKEIKGQIGGTDVQVVYHSPSMKGREIMGDLVPYGKVWRTGANDATTIELSADVKIEGKELKAGKYGLFTIPGEDEWTIIFNTKWKQWGAYEYSADEDVLRVTVKPGKTNEAVEAFEITVEKNGVRMAWENTEVMFKVK